MPVLVPSVPVDTDVTSLKHLVNPSSISPSSVLSEKTDKEDNPKLPFRRHNLRRNIRQKKCSCDCQSSCTTVIIERQYKEIGTDTVQEKTVITRTKVETYLEKDTVKDPSLQDIQTQCNNSFSESVLRRNGRRRSELQKLYDSLHEIKWAKNFSPDNILRQFDIRQAASSSAFGNSVDRKSPRKTRSSVNQDLLCNRNTELISKGSEPKRLTLNSQNSPYTARSTCHRSINALKKRKIDKNGLTFALEENASDLDTVKSGTYPILYKEDPKETYIDEKLMSEKFNFASSIKANCCDKDFFSKGLVNFDRKPQSVNCTDSFFDIAEGDIHTIDACFKEVGAEVIVQTCYETNYIADDDNLPLLTSVENIQDFEIKSDENPPVLECLISEEESETDVLADGLQNSNPCSKAISALPSLTNLSKTVFPTIKNSLILTEEEYQPPQVCFDEENSLNKVEGFDDLKKKPVLNNFKLNCNLPSLILINNTETVNNNHFIDQEPPLLELCPDISEEVFPVKNSNDDVFNSTPPKENCAKNRNNKFAQHLNNLKSHQTKRDSQIFSELKSTLKKSKKSTEENSNDKMLNISNTSAKINGISNCKFIPYLKFHHKRKTQVSHNLLSFFSARRTIKKYVKLANSKSRRDTSLRKFGKKTTRSKIRKNLNQLVKTSDNFKKKLLIPCETSSSTLQTSKTSISNKNFRISYNSDKTVFPSNKIISSVLSPKTYISDEKLQQLVKSDKILDTFFTDLKYSNYHSSPDSLSSFQSYNQTTELVFNNSKSKSVIKTFNQKLPFLKTEPAPLNEIRKSSTLMCSTKKEPSDFIAFSPVEKAKKSPIANSSSISEDMDKKSLSLKLLSTAKKKPTEKISPPVFSGDFQTINYTSGRNYNQITMKFTSGFLTHQGLVELKEAIIKADNDKDCKVLLLCGYGQTFCSGLDLRPLISACKNQIVGELAIAIKNLIETLVKFHKPLLAVVNGPVLGLGLTLLTHADVVLSTDYGSFCMPYSKLGYMPEGGATLTLPRTVGSSVAMDLLLRGQKITAQQALKIGLVNEVVELQKLPQILVGRIQAITQNSLDIMKVIKEQLKFEFLDQLRQLLEVETKMLPNMWLSPSCQDAMQCALSTGFLAHR